MRAILIDPKERTVTEIDFKYKDYTSIYPIIECQTFAQALRFENEDGMLIDDEGLFKDPEHFFMLTKDFPQPICGKAIIMGTDEDGNTVAAKTKLKRITDQINFMSRADTKLFQRAEQERVNKARQDPRFDHVIFGTMNEALGDLNTENDE